MTGDRERLRAILRPRVAHRFSPRAARQRTFGFAPRTLIGCSQSSLASKTPVHHGPRRGRQSPAHPPPRRTKDGHRPRHLLLRRGRAPRRPQGASRVATATRFPARASGARERHTTPRRDYLASSTFPIANARRRERPTSPDRATLTTPPTPPATTQPTKTKRAARVSCSAESERAPAAAATTVALSLLVSAGAQDLSAPPARAISARLEGTEIAELLAEREQTSTKKAPAPKAAPAQKAVPGASAPATALPAVKYAVPEPAKRQAPAPAPASAKKAPAPKPAPKPSTPAPAKKAAPAKTTYQTASEPKRAPVPKTDGPKPTPGKLEKANLAVLKTDAPVAVKGGKGMQLNTEASRPKSKLAAITAGGAGLGAVFGLGKAAGVAAGKGGAAKAAAVATQADAAEAVAVLVAGGAVGQTGTTIITKNSRVRKIRKTPPGELPLPIQAAAAASVPAGFVLALLQVLMSV